MERSGDMYANRGNLWSPRVPFQWRRMAFLVDFPLELKFLLTQKAIPIHPNIALFNLDNSAQITSHLRAVSERITKHRQQRRQMELLVALNWCLSLNTICKRIMDGSGRLQGTTFSVELLSCRVAGKGALRVWVVDDFLRATRWNVGPTVWRTETDTYSGEWNLITSQELLYYLGSRWQNKALVMFL